MKPMIRDITLKTYQTAAIHDLEVYIEIEMYDDGGWVLKASRPHEYPRRFEELRPKLNPSDQESLDLLEEAAKKLARRHVDDWYYEELREFLKRDKIKRDAQDYVEGES